MDGFDLEEYGQLLLGLRYRRGFRSGAKFAELITDLGTPLNEDQLWAIERGEREATVSRHFAFCHALKPPPGYFEEAFNVSEDDRQ